MFSIAAASFHILSNAQEFQFLYVLRNNYFLSFSFCFFCLFLLACFIFLQTITFSLSALFCFFYLTRVIPMGIKWSVTIDSHL